MRSSDLVGINWLLAMIYTPSLYKNGTHTDIKHFDLCICESASLHSEQSSIFLYIVNCFDQLSLIS